MAQAIVFPHVHGLRHILVFLLQAVLCFAAYNHVVSADFQFDDEPNITKCLAIRMERLEWTALKRAVLESAAPNRILVSASFALQYWASQFLPRLSEEEESGCRLEPWQFRLFNLCLHLLTGFAVYGLFLRLTQLPLAEKHIRRRGWLVAALGAMVWFCSPVQTQAITYIVQRAAALATFFYVLGILCYLEARARPDGWQRAFFFCLMLVCALSSGFSKEIGATIVIAVPALELLLIGRARHNLHWALTASACLAAVVMLQLLWFYGRTVDAGKGANVESSMALAGVMDDLVGKVKEDSVVITKVRVSPRQRLLTQARVVAMYQSLLVFPAPWRLTLDYDFRESLALFGLGEWEEWTRWIPLLLILAAAATAIVSPPAWRSRAFLASLLLLGAAEATAHWHGLAFLRISAVWTEPWPVPAIIWHALLMGFAALYSYRRPLLAFGVFFFYIGHLIESTVIVLSLIHI